MGLVRSRDVPYKSPQYVGELTAMDSWTQGSRGYHHQSSEKTIVILGNTGAGKCTLASHIFDDAAGFPVHGSVESTTRSPSLLVHDKVHNLGTQSVRVVIIDTGGLRGPNYDMWRVLQEIETLDSVNAIFFLMKFGRVTREDSAPINLLIRGLQNHADICYLVVTGCEGKSKAGRDDVINLYSRDEVTSNICSFVMRRKVITVGFPDIKNMASTELRNLYEEGMKEDEKTLQEIVRNSQSRRISVFEPWYRRLWSTVSVCTIL